MIYIFREPSLLLLKLQLRFFISTTPDSATALYRNLFKDIYRIIVIKRSSFIMLTIIKPFQKTFAFSYTESLFSTPGFQKSSPGFFKHESGFFRVRVRVFLESGFS
jgi:hypothetical protein